MKLAGKSAIVTGAGRDIGAAAAIKLFYNYRGGPLQRGEVHLYAASGNLFICWVCCGQLPMETAIHTIWPFYLAIFVALTMIAFIPVIYMTLTNLLWN